MVARIVSELGPWNWMVLGLALLALEIVVPGVFLLWIGIAAMIVGAFTLQFWDASWWAWQPQVLAFLALSLCTAWMGHKITKARERDSDEPLLNRRDAQLVGRTATLEEPIREGHGRIRIDDTVWKVTGQDTPAGTRVRVVKAAGGELLVEPV